tara:strand:- start:61 stop:1767 length:1707 start_codon:yes stop_codon:yes gene_type:complete
MSDTNAYTQPLNSNVAMLSKLETEAEIRFTGAVYTPYPIAKALVAKALPLCEVKNLKILEPSVGDGSFIEALLEHEMCFDNITAVDIDDVVIQKLSKFYRKEKSTSLSFVSSDFLDFVSANNNADYDLIIGNPPFIRKHNFSKNFKEKLVDLSKEANYNLKYMQNAWAAFVVASEMLLAAKGILALVLPYELINVGYGKKLISEIFSRFEQVDIYVPDEKAFKSIDQDAVIVIAQKKNRGAKGIRICRATDLENLDAISQHKLETHSSNDMSLELVSFLLPRKTTSSLKEIRENFQKIGDFCTSAPGLVTAANDFFILTENDTRKYGLSNWVKPVLKKGSYLTKRPIFSQEEMCDLSAKNLPTNFLYFDPVDSVSKDANAQKYIEYGESLGINKRYKCRQRQDWYKVPLGKIAEGFFFKRSFYYPRLCINEAKVLTTDTAYGISCFENYSMKGLCFSFYNSITQLFAEIDGRFYGGGVLELTPKEFRGLPVLYHEPSKEEFDAFLAVHDASEDISKSLLDFGDQWLSENSSFTAKDMNMYRQAWDTLRRHRLRHSRNAVPTSPNNGQL